MVVDRDIECQPGAVEVGAVLEELWQHIAGAELGIRHQRSSDVFDSQQCFSWARAQRWRETSNLGALPQRYIYVFTRADHLPASPTSERLPCVDVATYCGATAEGVSREYRTSEPGG